MFGRTPTPISGRAAAATRVAAILLLATLGGCARGGLPIGVPDTDRTITGSIKPARPNPPAAPAAAIASTFADPSDWEALRRALAESLDRGDADYVEWTNPDTGSSGVASATRPAVKGGVAPCRPFDTTMSDVRGVRRYSGEACKMTNGRWALRGIKPVDATLS
jgi:hypothetical protein